MKPARQTRVMFLLLLLLASLASWTHAGTQPITIEAVWTFPDSIGEDHSGLWLAGLDEQGRHTPAFAWYPVTTGWWPTWQMVLASETELLPIENTNAVSVPGWPDAVGLNLGTHLPAAGHVYRPLLSYDPEIGSVSVSLIDETAGETVYAHTFRAPKIEVDLQAASGYLGPTEADITISDIKQSPYYVPAGTYWRINPNAVDDGILSFVAANPQDELYLHVAVPDPAPRGSYRLVFRNGEFIQELTAVSQQSRGLPISLAGLPLGVGQLTLEYVEQGVVTLAQSRTFTVGRADVEIAKSVVNRDDELLLNTLILHRAPVYSELDISVEATIVELVWDTEIRNYVETPYSQKIIPVAMDFVLDTVDQMVELPIHVPLPEKPGMYRISYAPVIEPKINVSAAKQVNWQMFNTYKKPEPIQPGEPYTIAVLPDTQYMVANYPYILTRLMQWLMENAAEYNIELVLQVGDVTNNNTPGQWVVAQDNYTQLNGVLPYVLAIGNHDMSPGQGGQVAHRFQSLIKDYFPPESFSGLQGNFPEERLDNTYHTFHIAGTDYLVISLEFTPPDEVLEWANQVVAAHPDHTVIVVTHFYLAKDGTRAPQGRTSHYPLAEDMSTTMNDGAMIWYDFVRHHPNIVYVFGGHTYSPAIPWNIGYGLEGNMVFEFLVDFQSEDWGGNGYFALFEITPDNKLNVSAYSPFLGTYKNDRDKHGYTSSYTVDMSTGRVWNHEEAVVH
jgi:hypothetical protein